MKYFESAMLCSLTPVWFPYPKVMYIKWLGIFIYSLVMMAMWVWCLVTFPGFENNDSFD